MMHCLDAGVKYCKDGREQIEGERHKAEGINLSQIWVSFSLVNFIGLITMKSASKEKLTRKQWRFRFLFFLFFFHENLDMISDITYHKHLSQVPLFIVISLECIFNFDEVKFANLTVDTEQKILIQPITGIKIYS